MLLPDLDLRLRWHEVGGTGGITTHRAKRTTRVCICSVAAALHAHTQIKFVGFRPSYYACDL